MLTMLVIVIASAAAQDAAKVNGVHDTASKNNIVEHYGLLPLTFEANYGQADDYIRFISRGDGYALFLTNDGAVLALNKPPEQLSASKVRGSHAQIKRTTFASEYLRMALVNSDPKAVACGVDELPGKSNYFIGDDPSQWRTNVPTYGSVRYQQVYPGIDLVYYGDQRRLEYDFVVSPGADHRAIHLGFGDHHAVQIDDRGGLILRTATDNVRFEPPVIYQDIEGKRHNIAGHYSLRADNTVGFDVGRYDKSRPLVIDPVLSYSTYLGGGTDDRGIGIAVDSAGNTYVTGFTLSTNFPTASPLQAISGGGLDAFVTKINTNGSDIVYSTYFGGTGNDQGNGIAVDSAGNAYVVGTTGGSGPVNNFPVANPIFSCVGVGNNAFVSKLNASGSALIYSTCLGGSSITNTFGIGIALDSSGAVYITGQTDFAKFPTVNPIQGVYGGGRTDAFVSKINPSGSGLDYSTYLGGSGDDVGNSIAVDAAGNAYVTGATNSANFPTAGALQPTFGGGVKGDAFVAKINASGTALFYSTYLGGNGDDLGSGIAVDSAGNAYLTGFTASTNFPTANPLQATFGGGQGDAFVAKLNPSGSALIYSTYLDGISPFPTPNSGHFALGLGIAVDSSGNAYVTGEVGSINFPTANALLATLNGASDAFVTEFNASGTALVFSTYLGGSANEEGLGIAVDSSRNIYVTGGTGSSDFPLANPIQATFAGGTAGTPGGDAFVLKISPGTTLALVPGSLDFGSRLEGTVSSPQPVTLSNNTASPMTISSIGVTGNTSFDYSQTNNCGTTVAVSGSCTISVTFKPIQGLIAHPSYAGLTVMSGNPPTPQSISVAGMATVPPVQLLPATLTFGNQLVGTVSTPQVVTVRNNTTGTLTIVSIGIGGANAGDFAETNNCGTSITANAFCTVSVTFNPGTTGARNASLIITDNDPSNPQNAPLSGTGTAPAVGLSPANLAFGNQLVGTTGTPRTVTLSNTGTGPLAISGIGIAGPNASDFSETNNCGTSVTVGTSCTVSVTFGPATTGARNASLTIMDNAAGSPQSVPLSGTGTAPAVGLSPPSLTFGNQLVGTTSGAQIVTLSNTGTGVLSIASLGIAGQNPRDFAETNNCGASVAVGSSCALTITFNPTAGGPRNATLSISDSAIGSPQTLSLSGNATDFSLGPVSGSPTSVTFTAGQSATLNLQVSPVSGFTGTVNLGCMGTPAVSTCTISPTSVNISGTSPGVFSVTITTTARGASIPQPRGPLSLLDLRVPLFLATLLMLVIVARRIQRNRHFPTPRHAWLSAGIVLGYLAFMAAGCGGGGSGGGGGTVGTPAGIYSLTITGSQQGVNRTASLVLTIN